MWRIIHQFYILSSFILFMYQFSSPSPDSLARQADRVVDRRVPSPRFAYVPKYLLNCGGVRASNPCLSVTLSTCAIAHRHVPIRRYANLIVSKTNATVAEQVKSTLQML